MQCPRCFALMRPVHEQTPSGRIEVDYCPACRGIFFDHGELEALLQVDGGSVFSGRAALFRPPPGSLAPADKTRKPARCPRHREVPMTELVMEGARTSFLHAAGSSSALRIDRCPHCAGIWLDGGELGTLTESLRNPQLHPLLAPQPPPGVELRDVSPWTWLFMFMTGLPIETWQSKARRPQVVIALVILCALVFGLQGLDGPQGQLQALFALVPARLWRGDWLPLLSHMFLHGGLVHLLGNMYFLWIFGDNVEDRLGSGRFLLLYLISGVGAALLHCILTADPAMPVVGASGAISGVMAAYALLFPQARLVSLIFVFQVRWKTTTYLMLWLALQLLGALWGTSHVAWWAHIGGFLVGAALVWTQRPLVAKRQPVAAPSWPPVQPGPPPPPLQPLYWK